MDQKIKAQMKYRTFLEKARELEDAIAGRQDEEARALRMKIKLLKKHTKNKWVPTTNRLLKQVSESITRNGNANLSA